MGWFRSNNSPVDAGAAYGDINGEPDLAKFVHNNEKSQLRLESLSYNGCQLKLVISESGWVAIYEPSDIDAVEFTRFIRDEVVPYTTPQM
jgi:hypothetical protein